MGGINPLWSQKIVIKDITDYDVKIQFSLRRFDDSQEKVLIGDGSISLRDLFENKNTNTPQVKPDNNTESIEVLTERDMLPKVA